MRSPLTGALALALITLAATPQVAAATHSPNHRTVVGSFGFAPVSPVTGEAVTFTSSAAALGTNNRLLSQNWDLDNDGAFDDASGAAASRAFVPAGIYVVRLRALDRYFNEAIVAQSVIVRDTPLLSPFPLVQMGGRVTPKGTRMRLIVRAPVGATITVECDGRGCPLRRQTRLAKANPRSPAATTRLVRLRRLERRRLRAGARVTVLVSRPGAIGKYSRFRVRRGRPPKRTDSCVAPGTVSPIACPTS
jgi:hypothetical protein